MIQIYAPFVNVSSVQMLYLFFIAVLQSTSQGNSSTKAIRITQSLVRPHIRNIAPAPLPQQSQQQQQQPRQPKTLVLKTIPLKVKQVAPTTIKMPPRQTNQAPHNVVHQQPTEVCGFFRNYLLRRKYNLIDLYQADFFAYFRFA